MIRFTFCILYIYNVIFVDSIVVETTLGPIRGQLVEDELAGGFFYSFTGIPYAEAPVGELRWKPPVKKQPWTTVFNATKPGCVCPQPQLYYSREEMDEDCLNLNIYTPADALNKQLPVIIVIHSGDFDSQSGNAEPIYGPQFLLRSGIVVVTMNYRIGALGFLSLGTEEISGNAGVKDVILVLKIVNEIISEFGGDPNLITVRGNGAGAAMVQMLMLTSQTVDLFQAAMIHSGSILSSRYIQINPEENAMALARELCLNFNDYYIMVEKLKRVDAYDIVKAQEAISQKDPQRGIRIFKPFKPCVELENRNAILTRPPLELIREGGIRDVPVFTGFNSQEGLEMLPLLKKEPELIDKFNKNFELLIPEDIKYPQGSIGRQNLAALIRDFYFHGSNISLVNYINLISDTQHTYFIDLFVKLFKETKTSSIYYYVFADDTEINWFKVFTNITYPGGAHLDDLGYVFLTSAIKPRYQSLSSTTKRAQNYILRNGKDFVYYGVPPDPWPEAGEDRNHILIYNHRAIVFYSRPLPERIDFWSVIYERYRNGHV